MANPPINGTGVSAPLVTLLMTADKSVTLGKNPPRALISPVWMNHRLPGLAKPKLPPPHPDQRPSGGGSGYVRTELDSTAVPIDSHFLDDGTEPKSAVAVETVDGRIAYAGTPEETIFKFENCVTPAKAGKPATKIWMVDMLQVEQDGL